MKTTLTALFLATLVSMTGVVLTARDSQATVSQSLPACADNGDMDSDGVLDNDDSDETDSCLASSSGLEDCSTGAGDGYPDCE